MCSSAPPYPGLTPQQAQVWRDFFGMVSDLKVDIAIQAGADHR